jgi:hypothetical protein
MYSHLFNLMFMTVICGLELISPPDIVWCDNIVLNYG